MKDNVTEKISGYRRYFCYTEKPNPILVQPTPKSSSLERSSPFRGRTTTAQTTTTEQQPMIVHKCYEDISYSYAEIAVNKLFESVENPFLRILIPVSIGLIISGLIILFVVHSHKLVSWFFSSANRVKQSLPPRIVKLLTSQANE